MTSAQENFEYMLTVFVFANLHEKWVKVKDTALSDFQLP